jgi:hypothetical protein
MLESGTLKGEPAQAPETSFIDCFGVMVSENGKPRKEVRTASVSTFNR